MKWMDIGVFMLYFNVLSQHYIRTVKKEAHKTSGPSVKPRFSKYKGLLILYNQIWLKICGTLKFGK
jgi:hypothetical protein